MRFVFLPVLMIFLVSGSAACKKAPPPAAEPAAAVQQPVAAPPPQAPGAPAAPVQYSNAPSGAETARATSTCPENRKIDSGDTTQPGGPIYLAYKAALKGDSPEAFNEFYAQFVDGKSVEEIKRNIWSRVLQHVTKYTASAEDPSFVLCRQ